MINWIIIGILIVIVLVFVKVRHIKHRTVAIVIVLLLIFFYTTASNVISKENIDLGSASGVMKAGQVYFSWLWNAAGNVKELAGNVVKMNWAVDNSTAKLK